MVREVLRGCVEQQDSQKHADKGSENQAKKEKRRKKKEKKALAEKAADGGADAADVGDDVVNNAAAAGDGDGVNGSGGGGEDGKGTSKVHKRPREADDATAGGDLVAATRRQSKKTKRTHQSASDTGKLTLFDEVSLSSTLALP